MAVISFSAKVATAEKNKEDKYFMVGLADDSVDYENYVILQKAFKFDKQDKEAGMDGHYFEVNGQENSAYKVCERVVLTPKTITFHLDLGITEDLESVEVDITEVQLEDQFLEYLREILGEILVEEA